MFSTSFLDSLFLPINTYCISDTRCEKWRESRNESDILWYEKIRTLQQQQLQHIQRLKQEQQQIYQQHRHRQHEHIDDGLVARKDQQNPGEYIGIRIFRQSYNAEDM